MLLAQHISSLLVFTFEGTFDSYVGFGCTLRKNTEPCAGKCYSFLEVSAALTLLHSYTI